MDSPHLRLDQQLAQLRVAPDQVSALSLLVALARPLDATLNQTQHHNPLPAQPPAHPVTQLPTAGPSRGPSLFPAPAPLNSAPTAPAPTSHSHRPSLILQNGNSLPPTPSHLSAKASGKLPMAAKLAQHRAELAARQDGARLPPVPEELLLRDVINLIQGIDGVYVQFEPYQAPVAGPRRPYRRGMIVTDDVAEGEERPEEREARLEVGIRYCLDNTGYSLPAPTRHLVHQLAELGWLYKKIVGAIESGGGDSSRSLGVSHKNKGARVIGKVEQSLYAALNKEMTEYYGLIARLEAEMNEPTGGGGPGIEGLEGRLTLRRLTVWTEEMKLRMRLMATLVEEAGDHNAGGALLTSLHARTSNGDPFIRNFSAKLLTALSVPFFETLAAWIYEGELRDVCHEFFVQQNPAFVSGVGQGGDDALGEVEDFGAGDDSVERMQTHELWDQKFVFRKEMLPGFLEEAFGRKIFSTGKSLNFMKYSCHDAAWVVEKHGDDTNRTLQYSDMAGLERSIASAYSVASQRLFSVFFTKFRLMDHLRALKDYLMLGKGDFVEILMETLGPSLSKPANTLYRHDLTATLETALKGSTSAKDHPDTLRRLDARMLEFAQGELGWDVFTLEYKVEAPLDTVLDPKAMDSYSKMFKHLWQIKRVEYSLSQIWRRLMTGARTFLRVKGLAFDFHQTRISLGEMIFFIRQLQYYCHLEVIGCSWQVLEEFAEKKEGDLDSLIEAHRTYLQRLVTKALLLGGRRSKRSTSGEPSLAMLEQVRKTFSVMLQYREAADSLCNYALAEAARQESQRDVYRGIDSPVSSSRFDSPNPEALYAIRDRLAQYAGEFRELAVSLVTQLGQAPDLDMRFLAVRLNFNFAFVNPNAKVAAEQGATASAAPSVAGGH